MNSEETILWKGSPSQWTNFGFYFLWLLAAAAVVAGYFQFHLAPLVLAALAIPVLFILARWTKTRSHVYEVTTERIRITTGLLSRTTSEFELYRVRDYTLEEPFWLRLVGRGNILLETADRTDPHCLIRAVPHAAALKDQIRAQTERLRQTRGVRDIEINPQ
jgi:uncharacterized membrane protein YdbT with pleckstrin-like domain